MIKKAKRGFYSVGIDNGVRMKHQVNIFLL
jgi:hypothetical protein